MKVICISAKAQHGKDTSAIILKDIYEAEGKRVLITHYADLLKYICKTFFGWNGEKDDRARKFLSDLKALTAAYNDFPTKWLCRQYETFLQNDEELMFVHIREGAEIDKFVLLTGGNAKTLLIRGGERMRPKCETGYGNASDDQVENYSYDYYFVNDKPLEETEASFLSFIESILNV